MTKKSTNVSWGSFQASDDDDTKLPTTPIVTDEEDPIKEKEEEEEGPQEEPEEGEDPKEDEPETEPEINVEDEDESFSFAPVVEALADKDAVWFNPDKEYEDSEEGFLEVIKDTVDKRFEEMLEDLPEEARKIIEIAKAGGDIREAFEVMAADDYSQADIKDEDTQKTLIRLHLESQGVEEEDIEEKLSRYEDLGSLEAEAKMSQKYLVKLQAKEKEDYEASIKEAAKAKEAERGNMIEALKSDLFALDEVQGFKLDKRTKQALFDHITKPVGKNGETQLQLNRKNKENQFFAALLDMKNYSFKDLEKSVETKISGNLKKTLSRFTATDAASKKGSRQVEATRESVKVPKGIWDIQREED